MGILDARQNEQIHKSFDECRLPRPDRTDDPDVNAAAGAGGDIMKQIEFFHAGAPLTSPWRKASLLQSLCGPMREIVPNYFSICAFLRCWGLGRPKRFSVP